MQSVGKLFNVDQVLSFLKFYLTVSVAEISAVQEESGSSTNKAREEAS